MKTRKTYLLKDDAFTAARTKIVDLNVVDPISSIDILVEMTNGSAMTEASVVKPHDEFTKIELVDGADVLVSASMEELQALNFAEMKRAPLMELTLDDDDIQREMCHIHFGVDRNDPNHYLRPQDFRNLQLKITNTFTTAAVTSWAASGHTVTVIANVIEEGAKEYDGFLTTKSMYSFTAVDGAVETIDMPNDYPYRMIQLQALASGSDVILSLEKVKLTCDADKYIPFEVDFDHLVMANALNYGSITQNLVKRITGLGDVYSDLYYLVQAAATVGTTLYVANVQAVAGEKISIEHLGQT